MQEREPGAGENSKHIVMFTYLVQVTLSVALRNITPPNSFRSEEHTSELQSP